MAALSPLVDDVLDQHLNLAWTWWCELGVPGASSRPSPVTLHPEALVVFSASLVVHDARLREGMISWLLANHHLLGSRQVLNVANRLPAVPAGMGDFSATLAIAGGPKWAGHTPGRGIPGNYGPLDRPLRLERPALALLRLRAALGVHARTEILALLASEQAPTMTHAEIALHVASTPRNVRLALDDLVLAQVVGAVSRSGATRYRCQRPDAFQSWVGPLPPMPPWVTLLPALAALRTALTDHTTDIERAVAARRMLDHHGDTLRWLDLPPPPRHIGQHTATSLAEWLLEITPVIESGVRVAPR